MSRLVLILILSLTSLGVSFENSIGSRSILRAIDDKDLARDFAVDLNTTNFDAVLGDTPATYAIVEFFAHWCPACRNYKPHYEKVARLFNGPNSVHPGIILMTRVDCALKINSKLCDYFSVDHYPMLLWGSPSKFISSSWGPKHNKSGVVLIDDGRTADRLLSWINKQLDSSYGLDDGKFQNDHSPNVSDIEQIVRAVYDVEEATSTAIDIILIHKMIKPNTRASLIKFLQLLVAHHPSRRCRKGSAEILVSFDEFYPLNLLSSNTLDTVVNGKATIGNILICGKEVPRGYWMFCRGSKNETRGFSCGLWVLLHSLSVRTDDGESQFAFTAMCDFIHNFFICEECRQHFYQMCSSVSTPFNTTRDFALWLWSAHNEVNKRLMKDEAALETGDPKFPKLIWPQKQLCPSCSLSTNPNNNDETSPINWDRDEVFKFLVNYYGKKLVSQSKDRSLLGNAASLAISEDLVGSTNALAVPLGAALAIGIASCAFGALACYWRSHQKNRKYFHHLHSLKNI